MKIRSFRAQILNIPISVVLMMVVILVYPLLFMTHFISDKDTVLFRHDRVGLNGKIISVYKFRTIISKTREWTVFSVFATHVFKFIRETHLDEFPQCVNVMRGEMNIVGPRPYIARECDISKSQIPDFEYRHSVKPGITGYAQVRYDHNNTGNSSQEKFILDKYYIQNQSLSLDLMILGKTMREVIKLRGI